MDTYDSVMATPCRGTLDSLFFRWGKGGRLCGEFKVIDEHGRNLSAVACAKLLPRSFYDQPLHIFEIGEMYSVDGCGGLYVKLRELDTPGDILFEILYSPGAGNPSVDPVGAVCWLGNRLHELGVIGPVEAGRVCELARSC